MNHKVSIGVTISIAAIVCALTFILTSFFSLQSFNEKVQAVKEKAEKYDRLEALDTYVRANYYKTELDEDGLMDGILKGYVAGLNDPYSVYYTNAEFEELLRNEDGKKLGIGVTIRENEEDGYILVTKTAEGSPAEESGIKGGDLIVKVNGTDVAETGYENAIDMMRGEEGTELRLVIRRDGKDRKIDVTLRSYEVKTVSFRMLDGQVGYIRITHFRQNTAEQFQEALDDLTANGARSLIFDVRQNGGGLVTALERMLDPLLPEGIIATATYQDGKTETIVESDAREMDLPMAVLVDGGSASAAELFSASLRDFGKAKLIGTTTFGKGVMQNTIRQDDGSGLKLTVATYQTTRSDCYQDVGLVPDLVVEALPETDIEVPDRETDPQLAAAIDLVLAEQAQ